VRVLLADVRAEPFQLHLGPLRGKVRDLGFDGTDEVADGIDEVATEGEDGVAVSVVAARRRI